MKNKLNRKAVATLSFTKMVASEDLELGEEFDLSLN